MARITSDKAAAVERLLAEGRTQRAIAKLVGVSRGVVNNIAKGRWAPRPPGSPPPPRTSPFFTGPVVRCPVCRVKVYMPCRACAVRKLMEKKS